MTFSKVRLRRFVESACDGPFGSAIKSEHYMDEGARVIRLGNIGPAYWRDSDRAFLDMEYWRGLESHHAKPDDVVVAGLGDEGNPVGRACVLPASLGPALVKADCYRLRLNQQAEPQFVAYVLSSSAGLGAAAAMSEGSTRPRLTLGRTLALECPSVPIDQQRRIAHLLNAETAHIDALVAKKRHLGRLGYHRFSCLVHDGVAGRLTAVAAEKREVSLDWLGPIPKDWGCPPLGANFEVVLGKMLNEQATSTYPQYPYLRNVNVQWDRLDMEDLASMHFGIEEQNRYRLKPGDLLVCEGGEVGRAALWPGTVEDIFIQKAIHRVRVRGTGDPRFLMYCLMAAANQRVFQVEGNQATIPHLTAEKLRAHRFPWPPIEEQRRIVQILDEQKSRRDRLVATLEHQIALLQERRQALITAAVTGELEIPAVSAA